VAYEEGGLTLRRQAARVAGGGEAEPCWQRLGRAGHHADPVDVARLELASPRGAAEVLVVTLAGAGKKRYTDASTKTLRR